MTSHDHVVSTGRGGQGNIGRDENVYVPGDIIREGYDGSRNPHSTGRGGAGNIGADKVNAGGSDSGAQQPDSADYIPETAMRSAAGHENFHTGRGGEGNIHREKFAGHSQGNAPSEKEGLGEKVKHIFHKDEKKHDMA